MVNRGEEKVRVHMNVVPRSTTSSHKWWNRELTLKCKLKCYVKPMKDPSCGSLIPVTGANAQWVFHGFHIAIFVPITFEEIEIVMIYPLIMTITIPQM